MQIQQRFNAFAKLGHYLQELSANTSSEILSNAAAHNGWFSPSNIKFSLQSWSQALSADNLDKWISKYNLDDRPSKTIGIVMAGNIPLVGFHDFLSVLMTGNKVIARLSSNDKILLPHLAEKLAEFEPEFKDRFTFAEGKLENFDAVIATGSNNTSRYFDYYFGKYPHIIRKNRNSVAVLDGNETKAELEALADVLKMQVREGDILAYLRGEQFILSLPEMSVDASRQFAQRMLSVLQDARQNDLFQQMDLQVGLSTLADFSSRCTETALELLITRADLAMKAGKAAGETICHYDDLAPADADSATHLLQKP